MNNKVTYRQQFTRCGKQRCRKCKEGAGHGPYWYAYWSENGRTISKYIGIHPPAGIEITATEPIATPEQSPAGELDAANYCHLEQKETSKTRLCVSTCSDSCVSSAGTAMSGKLSPIVPGIAAVRARYWDAC
jgi:hypothetical protein